MLPEAPPGDAGLSLGSSVSTTLVLAHRAVAEQGRRLDEQGRRLDGLTDEMRELRSCAPICLCKSWRGSRVAAHATARQCSAVPTLFDGAGGGSARRPPFGFPLATAAA